MVLKGIYKNAHRNLTMLAPNEKQFKCPPTVVWIHKVWYVHTTDYYPAVKRNKRLLHMKAWMTHRHTFGRSHTEKHVLCDFKGSSEAGRGSPGTDVRAWWL